MTWAQRLKRVFGIDIETCPTCGGAAQLIACIEDPGVIEKFLSTCLETISTTPSLTLIRAPNGALSTIHYSDRWPGGLFDRRKP
jgi:hypothetical protein